MFPCSTCNRLRAGLEQGIDGCTAPDEEPGMICAGPLAGGVYPLYSGPLTPESMRERCVFCGSHETVGHVEVRVFGLPRRFGLCAKHLPRAKDMSARGTPEGPFSRAGESSVGGGLSIPEERSEGRAGAAVSAKPR